MIDIRKGYLCDACHDSIVFISKKQGQEKDGGVYCWDCLRDEIECDHCLNGVERIESVDIQYRYNETIRDCFRVSSNNKTYITYICEDCHEEIKEKVKQKYPFLKLKLLLNE